MALIPTQYLNAVVSIEIEVEKEQKDGTKKRENISIATGFLYGRFIKQEGELRIYAPYLVTNRHVFQDLKTKEFRKEVFLRFNLTEKKGIKYAKIDLIDGQGKPIWLSHKNENVDLAVLPINGPMLGQEGIEYYFFREDGDVFFANSFADNGISIGDGIFVLGYPLGERGKTRNFVIVKGGILARCDDELLKEHFFLIDSSAYPGNSGGPVINKPEVAAVQGTKNAGRSGLIGVISSGITYEEAAISAQTGKARIIFEEQTGLVRVVPIDSVNETIDQYVKVKGEPEQVEEVKNEK